MTVSALDRIQARADQALACSVVEAGIQEPMNWGKPHRIAGNRLAIDSSCGRYCITRPEQSENSRYQLQKLTGSVYSDMGEFNDKDEAIAAAEDDYEFHNRH